MFLQVLDIGDSSESFPGNCLDLVLAEVSGERESKRHKTLAEVFQALRDVQRQTINKTTNMSSMTHTHKHTHTHTHTHKHMIDNYKTKAERENEIESGRERKDDMTFMISGTIWTKELQRHGEISEPKCVCVCVCVCVHMSLCVSHLNVCVSHVFNVEGFLFSFLTFALRL